MVSYSLKAFYLAFFLAVVVLLRAAAVFLLPLPLPLVLLLPLFAELPFFAAFDLELAASALGLALALTVFMPVTRARGLVPATRLR